MLAPSWTAGALEAAYARVTTTVNAQWADYLAQQDRELVDFIQREATTIDASTVLEFGRADRPPLPAMMASMHHQDVRDVYVFRRGLLKVTVERPRATSTGVP